MPWLNHDLNASFNLPNTGGPISRSQALLSCNGSFLAYNVTAGSPSLKPYLRTLLQSIPIPAPTELPPIPEDPKNPGTRLRAENEQASPQHRPAPRHRRLRAVVLRHPALPLDHLRRPDAVQGEAVRDQDPLQRGDPARRTVRRADLRRLGRQSAEDRRSPERPAGAGDGRHRRPVRADPEGDAGDPADQDAARRDLRRTDPGARRRARSSHDGETLPLANVAESVQLDEIFRTFDARTRSAFQEWMQQAAVAIEGQGAGLSNAFAELDPTFTEFDRLFRVLDTQRARGQAAVQQRRRHLPRPARARRPARRPDPQLQRGLPDDRRARPRHRSAVPRLPDLRGRVAADLRPAARVRASTPTR